MKLEPANGNPVMPPLKLASVLVNSKVEPQQQQQTKEDNEMMMQEEEFENYADDDEDEGSGHDEVLAGLLKEAKQIDKLDNNEIGENEEEITQGGKKKGTRKKRSINWEEAERSLLVEVIKPRVDFVENRAVDAKSIKSKRLAWIQISKQFNSLNFRQRSLEQIQVQWRSMKNAAKKEYQQKNPKSTSALEGLQMLEFMEEMQKEPVGSTRSQTRSLGVQNKKEPMDIDEEDTPLAALPTTSLSNSNSEDTLPSSTIALPSPPNSAESQLAEFQQQEDSTRPKKKKVAPKTKPNNITAVKAQTQVNHNAALPDNTISGAGFKVKRQKSQNSSNSESNNTNISLNANAIINPSSSSSSADIKPSATLTLSSMTTPPPSPPVPNDDTKYKKQLFDLIKRVRLAEMDCTRKEHEQKLRFEQQEQELKLRQMCELHEQRMRFALIEHEARMHLIARSN
uniref:Regulatory protein zeste n=1 Tax=Glossina brevipalpis TaxID=37001 RepID=A0A1A9WI56_9MUSC